MHFVGKIWRQADHEDCSAAQKTWRGVLAQKHPTNHIISAAVKVSCSCHCRSWTYRVIARNLLIGRCSLSGAGNSRSPSRKTEAGPEIRTAGRRSATGKLLWLLTRAEIPSSKIALWRKNIKNESSAPSGKNWNQVGNLPIVGANSSLLIALNS